MLILMAAIGTGGFLGSLVLFQVLERNSPAEPVVAVHRIVQMNSHGHLFYVTHGQWLLFYSLLVVGWSLVALAALLNLRWKAIHNLTPDGWDLPK